VKPKEDVIIPTYGSRTSIEHNLTSGIEPKKKRHNRKKEKRSWYFAIQKFKKHQEVKRLNKIAAKSEAKVRKEREALAKQKSLEKKSIEKAELIKDKEAQKRQEKRDIQVAKWATKEAKEKKKTDLEAKRLDKKTIPVSQYIKRSYGSREAIDHSLTSGHDSEFKPNEDVFEHTSAKKLIKGFGKFKSKAARIFTTPDDTHPIEKALDKVNNLFRKEKKLISRKINHIKAKEKDIAKKIKYDFKEAIEKFEAKKDSPILGSRVAAVRTRNVSIPETKSETVGDITNAFANFEKNIEKKRNKTRYTRPEPQVSKIKPRVTLVDMKKHHGVEKIERVDSRDNTPHNNDEDRVHDFMVKNHLGFGSRKLRKKVWKKDHKKK